MHRPGRLLLFVVVACGAACAGGTAAQGAGRRPGSLVDATCPREVGSDARCSTLYVHENRSTRRGRLIPLRIVVRPAHEADGRASPIFFLAGGPGQAVTELMGYAAFANPSWRVRHDLVFVDQRGTGGSHALTCRFYGPLWDVESYFGPFLPIGKVRECRDQLSARADLTQYTTAYAVEDLEEVRVALQYERINLVGASYGTRLALEYVRRYEPRVRSVILEGVAAPSMHVPEGFALAAQQALDRLLDECAGTHDCAAAFPSIRDMAPGVFEKLKAGPVRATVAHPGSGQPVEVLLTKEHVAEAIRYMTYSSHRAREVPHVLDAAHRGNYSALAAFLLRWRADGTFDGLYLSITCTEDVPFVSTDAEARAADTYLAGYRVREQKAACVEWPRGPEPEWIGHPVVAQTPALIISGALDPVTPPAAGETVAKTLANSLHVTVPFGGHSLAGLDGLECLERLKTAFLERGSVEGLNPGCVSRIRRPPFAGADLR